MKEVMLILVLVLMVSQAFGSDPNSMEIPSTGNPVTKCVQPEELILTIKIKVSADQWHVVTDPGFTANIIVKRWLSDITKLVEMLRASYAAKIPLETLKSESEKNQ